MHRARGRPGVDGRCRRATRPLGDLCLGMGAGHGVVDGGPSHHLRQPRQRSGLGACHGLPSAALHPNLARWEPGTVGDQCGLIGPNAGGIQLGANSPGQFAESARHQGRQQRQSQHPGPQQPARSEPPRPQDCPRHQALAGGRGLGQGFAAGPASHSGAWPGLCAFQP
ncbi:hypothetical protein D3C71_1392240 [compost metagenome]